MALREEKEGVPPQDKLEFKGVTFPSAKVDETGTVFYYVVVESSFNSWTIVKRYSQFEELHNALLLTDYGKKIPAGCDLPPKKFKFFTSHTSTSFIEGRRVLLEAYLKRLLRIEDIAHSLSLSKFLSTDKTEKAVEGKKRPEPADDVEVTGVNIPATRTMSDHVLYQIDVSNSKKTSPYDKWTVLKRFGQFYDVDCLVRAAFIDKPHVLEKLPEPPERKAKLLNDHMDETFIEQRRVLLTNYLNNMLDVAEVVRNKDFLAFLGVDI